MRSNVPSFSIELAKITRPRIFEIVPRTRLFRRLDALRKHPAIWISAPPGAGKTTLAASYIEARKLPALWYQIDRGDADVAGFFYHVGLAAARLRPRRKEAAPLLTPEHQADVPGFARRYFRRLYANLPSRAIIVLDNLHEIEAGSAMAAVMAIALEEIPNGVNVVAISREEPPAPLIPLVMAGKLARLDWFDLRFNRAEAGAVLAPSLPRHAGSARLVSALLEAAGGWAAALVLLREHLRRAPHALEPLAASQEAIFNFFAGQVFEGLPPDVRGVLLATAYVPTFTSEIARQLSGNPETGKILDSLYRRHLFIDRRRGTEAVYQYHALFREFLMARAGHALPREERLRLIRAAASLLQTSGKADEAFELYCLSRDWEGAAALIRESAPSLLQQGRRATLQQWVRKLPRALGDNDPWLLYWIGMSQLRVSEAETRRCLQQAFDAFAGAANVIGQLLAACAMLEAIHAHGANYRGAELWIKRVESLFFAAGRPAFSAVDEELRAGTGLLIAMLLGERSPPGLEAHVERIMSLLDAEADVNRRLAAATVVLEYFGWERRYDMIEVLACRVGPLLDDRHASAHAQAKWHIWLGQILYNRVLYDEALAAWQHAREIGRREGLGAIELEVAQYELLQRLSVAEVGNAQALLAAVEAQLGNARPMDLAFYHYQKAWLRLLEDNGEAALREAGTALQFAQKAGLPATRLGTYFVMEAYASIKCGAYAAALARLRQAVASAPPLRAAQLQCLVSFTRALRAMHNGDAPGALRCLRTGFAGVRELQYPMFFRPLPDVVSRLCGRAFRADIETETVRSIVRLRGLAPAPDAIQAWPWPLRIRALGRFAVEREGKPLEFTGKAQKKPLDLLKVLLASGGRSVDGAHITAALWPEAEGDAARHAFDVTLARLRKLLGVDQALLIQGGKLSFNADLVWIDVAAFEDASRRLENTGPAAGARSGNEAAEAGNSILELYRGHFLADEAPESWALPMRDRLRSKFLRLVVALGLECEQGGEWRRAIQLYQRGLEQDNLAEELYRRLICCHAEHGERAAALNAYRRCRELLSVVLGVAPAPETEALYQAVRAD